MNKVYVVVAEQSRARLFGAETPLGKLHEIEDMSHPEGRRHEHDLGTDKPGRNAGTGGAHHALPSRETIHEHEARLFAHFLAERVEQARLQGEFEQLVLVAPPDFLGLLRAELSELCLKRVIRSVDKNLVTLSADAIRRHLSAH